MKKNYKIYNVIILDESGSMEAIKNFTINGFNQVLETIQQAEKEHLEQAHYVTFISFNTNGIKTHLFNEPASRLKALSLASFRPDACTPLFDAMGSGLSRQRDAIAGQKNTEVLVTILTDGLENASVEYTQKAVNSLVSELKKQGWTITYMGANHDVEKFTASIGIEHHIAFSTNEADMKQHFISENKNRMAFYCKAGMADKGEYFQEDKDKEENQEKPPKDV
jgi:Mg-chelatase subunit ChlD